MHERKLNFWRQARFPFVTLSVIMISIFVIVHPIGLNVSSAAAHSLEDQKSEIDRQAKEVEHSLEFLDANIAESAADLTRYQEKIPQVQEEVNLANANVADAAAKVWSVRQQLQEAQDSRAAVAEKIKADEDNLAQERRNAGKIAAQSYKNIGLEPGLYHFIPAVPDAHQLQTLSLLERASDRKIQTISMLNGFVAAKENSQERLKAVEERVKELKREAETVLDAQERIKNEAVVKQSDLNALVKKTKNLNNSLLARKPAIEKKVVKLRAQQKEVATRIAEEQRKARANWLAEQAAAGNADPVTAPLASGTLGFIHPIQAPITSGFGWRSTPPGTIDFWGTGGYMHTGIDFGASCGTAVQAPAAGKVTVAGWLNNGGGNTVKIDHGIIGGNAVSTVFYHNTGVAVAHGAQVSQGQTVSYVGSTGNSTGCHAHFEVWVNGQAIDPLTVL